MNEAAFGFGRKLLALTFSLPIVGFALAGGLTAAAAGVGCPFEAVSGFFSSPVTFLPLNGGIAWMNMFVLGFALAGVAVEGGAAGAAAALGAGLLFGGWAPIARAWALAASLAARSRIAF